MIMKKIYKFISIIFFVLIINSEVFAAKIYQCNINSDHFYEEDTLSEAKRDHKLQDPYCNGTLIKIEEEDDDDETAWWDVPGHIENAVNNFTDDMTSKIGENLENWANDRVDEACKQTSIFGRGIINNVIFPENNIKFFKILYSNIKTIIISLTSSLIILYTLFYGFKVYVLWKDGNPEENPIEIITRYLFALALILSFDEIYKIVGSLFVSIITKMADTVSKSGNIYDFEYNAGGILGGLDILGGLFLFLIVKIVYLFQWCKALFNTLKNGLEMFLLRLGFPLACINIVLPQGNTFNAYIMVFIKNFLSLLISIIMIGIADKFNDRADIFCQMWAVACLFLLNGSKELLNQFLIPSQGGGIGGTIVSQTMNGAGQVVKGIGRKIITHGAG